MNKKSKALLAVLTMQLLDIEKAMLRYIDHANTVHKSAFLIPPYRLSDEKFNVWETIGFVETGVIRLHSQHQLIRQGLIHLIELLETATNDPELTEIKRNYFSQLDEHFQKADNIQKEVLDLMTYLRFQIFPDNKKSNPPAK